MTRYGSAQPREKSNNNQKKVNTVFPLWERSLFFLFPAGKKPNKIKGPSALSVNLRFLVGYRALGPLVPRDTRRGLQVGAKSLCHPSINAHRGTQRAPLPPLLGQNTHRKTQEVSGWGCAEAPFHPRGTCVSCETRLGSLCIRRVASCSEVSPAGAGAAEWYPQPGGGGSGQASHAFSPDLCCQSNQAF